MRYLTRTWQRLTRSIAQFGNRHAGLRRGVWGVLFFALITGILMEQVQPPGVNLQVDVPSSISITAPYQLTNKVLTDQKRKAAAAAVQPIYMVDANVQEQALENVRSFFDAVSRVREQDAQGADKIGLLRNQISQSLSDSELAAVLNAPAQDLSNLRAETLRVLTVVLSSKIGPADVETVRGKLDSGQPALKVDDKLLSAVARDLIKGETRANVIIDNKAWDQAKAQAMEKVEPEVVKPGEEIVTAGRRVTPDQYEMLRELGYIGVRANSRVLIGAALFALAMLMTVALYLIRYRPDIVEHDRKLVLLGIITVLTFVLGLFSEAFKDPLGPSAGYLLPVAVGTMLVTITLDAKVAILVGVCVSLLIGAATGYPWPFVVVALTGGLAGAYSVTRVETRTALIKAGLVVGLSNALVILAIFLLQGGLYTQIALWKNMGLGALGGLISAVLTIGLLPFLENLFGVLTPLKLLELSNPNHPLLKKLLVEAPGSYHHTILVANLCEAAAEAIGADAMLARVGAYFHDVGKSKRPYFFVENQFGQENPHDRLPANLSALIIASHVKDGYEMAREARLPREIQDFVLEHHGTMLISYFYNKANQEGPEQVPEHDFRYEGPKPQSKETAICMLADGCEASVRAMRMKGPLTLEDIAEQVRRIIHGRMQDGQLEECPLTLRDLEVISRSFVKVLSGVHHARIEYPNMPTAGQPMLATAAPATLPSPGTGADGDAGSEGKGAAPGAGMGKDTDVTAEEESRGDLHRQRAGAGAGSSGNGTDDAAGDHAGSGEGGKPSGR